MDTTQTKTKAADEVATKPIELVMDELRTKILNECANAKMNLYFINSVLENIYKEVHEQYVVDLNKRAKEYYNSIKDGNKIDVQNENENKIEKEV